MRTQNRPYRTLTTLFLFILFINQAAATPDYEREKRWASEVIPSLIVGEPIYITQKNSHKFLGIFSESNNLKMGIIVAHGMGLHPDWGMIGTLRQGLFDEGYTTLSIQMPILEANASYKAYPALFPEAAERLKLATAYLKARGYQKITIVSHSNGSRMSRVYMLTNPVDVTTWIALSLTQGDTFKGINAAVFDLYGDGDLDHVLSSASKRKASFRNNTLSKQKIISNANHFFSGREEAMLNAVANYLKQIQY